MNTQITKNVTSFILALTVTVLPTMGFSQTLPPTNPLDTLAACKANCNAQSAAPSTLPPATPGLTKSPDQTSLQICLMNCDLSNKLDTLIDTFKKQNESGGGETDKIKKVLIAALKTNTFLNYQTPPKDFSNLTMQQSFQLQKKVNNLPGSNLFTTTLDQFGKAINPISDKVQIKELNAAIAACAKQSTTPEEQTSCENNARLSFQIATTTNLDTLRKLAYGIPGTDNIDPITIPSFLGDTSKNISGAKGSMNFMTFFKSPSSSSMYEYNNTNASNYVDLFLDLYGFNNSWINNDAITAIQSKLTELKDKSTDRKNFIDSLRKDPTYLDYKLAYRSAVARQSLLSAIIYSMKSERTCGKKGCQDNPSELQRNWTLNNGRATDPKWVTFIKTASSTSVLRQIAFMQAQQLANQYQQHIDAEKTQSLLVLLNQQLLAQSGDLNKRRAQELKKAVDKLTGADDDENNKGQS